jgi:hypothetical protein
MAIARTRVRETDVREAVADPARATPALGRGEALGRDGKVIRRVRVSDDKFEIPSDILEATKKEGWVYQWNVVSVLGKEDHSAIAGLYRAGWTSVPAERHPGVFLPSEMKGSIVIDGLMLMERPIALELEAKAEERQAALSQVNGSRQQFGFSPTAAGFEGADKSNHPAVRNNSFVKVSYEEVTTPRPKYEMSVD